MDRLRNNPFWKKYDQRRIESILQFTNLVRPEVAAQFIVGVHDVNEQVHLCKTDTILINQRGGMAFDWAMKKFDSVIGRKTPRTIYFPIGTEQDIVTVNTERNPTLEQKKAIVSTILDLNRDQKLGNVTLIEEAKSGTSISTFLMHMLPILEERGLLQCRIIAALHPGSPIEKDQSFLLALSKKYGVPIDSYIIPLSLSDHRSFVDELSFDPLQAEGPIAVPHTIHNPEIHAMVDLMVLIALYPGDLHELLTMEYTLNKDMYETYKKATSNLTNPGYVYPWLQKYSDSLSK